MSFNKVLFTALLVAMALGIHLSTNQLEAQAKSYYLTSSHMLKTIIQTVTNEDQTISK